MPGEQEDPFIAYGFAVELDGVQVAQFKSCSGLETNIEVIETRQSDAKGQTVIMKTAGQTQYGDVTFTRGMTKDMALVKWFNDVVAKGPNKLRKTAAITTYDSEGKPGAVWNMEGCWPRSLKSNPMEAGGNDLVVEEMTFVSQSLVRKS